jgi:NCAIR mutase (PurE)-related protein
VIVRYQALLLDWGVVAVRDILRAVSEGALTPDEAEKRLNLFAVTELEGLANLDAGRNARLGRPEIIRCSGKPVSLAVEMAASLLELQDLVILSGATAEHASLLRSNPRAPSVSFEETAGLIVARKPGSVEKTRVGRVSIVTAGTSDVPIALQAKVIVETLGVHADLYPDVGISGLHRLFPVVKQILDSDPDVIIAIAGQEGGLAPVLAGLVDIPIVGLPTSTGSGFGGEGLGALTTMLQACSMGIAVVNIDNGIAAGVVASSIARRSSRDQRDT